MHWDADGAGLVGDGTGDGLADPPGRIGGELESLGVVELFHRFDQTQIALLDQIQELHAAAHIPLGNGDHQTQVGLAQTLLGFLAIGAAGLDLQRQIHLLFGGQQRHTADFFQIDLHRVINGNAVRRKAFVVFLQRLAGQRGGIRQHITGIVVHDLNAAALQLFIQLFHLFHVHAVAALLHGIADLGVGELAGTAACLDQAANGVSFLCHK